MDLVSDSEGREGRRLPGAAADKLSVARSTPTREERSDEFDRIYYFMRQRLVTKLRDSFLAHLPWERTPAASPAGLTAILSIMTNSRLISSCDGRSES